MKTPKKPQPIHTSFTDHFDIKYPIICAPMFLVSSVEMVVKASNAGGLGTFPAFNYRPIENYRKAIREIKQQTKLPFGVNIIVQKSNKFQKDQLEIALDEKVPLIISSLGNPKEVIRLAHEVGTKVYCDIVNIEHAKKVIGLGADGLIAVGSGAGGHAGDISIFALIPSLKKMCKVEIPDATIPIIAAGSIVDGIGMLASLSLGASAIYMGTRFIVSKESEAPDEYKNAILNAISEDIVNTDKVDGFPGNFIKSPRLEKLGIEPGIIEFAAKKHPKLKRWIAMSRAASILFKPNDKMKTSYKTIFSAGHGVGLIEKIESIEDIITNTVIQYYQLKKQLP